MKTKDKDKNKLNNSLYECVNSATLFIKSPSPNAKVWNMWSHASIYLYIFMVWYLTPFSKAFKYHNLLYPVAVLVNIPVIATLKFLGSITSNHEDWKMS
jgi:hypothetical protein